jgi:hypothetical protein
MTEWKERIDILDRILNKNLGWIAGADAKATMLFAVDSAMLGVLVAVATRAGTLSSPAAGCAALAGLALAAGVCCIVGATFPRLKDPQDSLIYFGGIASHDEAEYMCRLLEDPLDDLAADFARQCYKNAEIAKAKYHFVRKAAVATFVALPAWVIAIGLMVSLKTRAL